MSDLIDDVERVSVYVDGERIKHYVNRREEDSVQVIVEQREPDGGGSA